LGLAIPDEDIPNVVPDLTSAEKVILGLVSHGLSNEQIVAATSPYVSENAVKRLLTGAGDQLMEVRGLADQRRDAALTTTLAFEQEVFSVQPDLAMSPEFLISGMRHLLDPGHEFVPIP
jgi:hypothetical protein